jgi:hypothetical protein
MCLELWWCKNLLCTVFTDLGPAGKEENASLQGRFLETRAYLALLTSSQLRRKFGVFDRSKLLFSIEAGGAIAEIGLLPFARIALIELHRLTTFWHRKPSLPSGTFRSKAFAIFLIAFARSTSITHSLIFALLSSVPGCQARAMERLKGRQPLGVGPLAREIPRWRCSLGITIRFRSLNIVIEMEFIRVRAHPDGIRLILFLVVDPQFDVVLGEDSAFGKELVIVAEFLERLIE